LHLLDIGNVPYRVIDHGTDDALIAARSGKDVAERPETSVTSPIDNKDLATIGSMHGTVYCRILPGRDHRRLGWPGNPYSTEKRLDGRSHRLDV